MLYNYLLGLIAILMTIVTIVVIIVFVKIANSIYTGSIDNCPTIQTNHD